MSLQNTIPNSGTQVEGYAVVASLFHDEAQAERAMQELREAGFSGSQIGVACSDPEQEKTIAAEADGRTTTAEIEKPLGGHRSLLERLKHFFTGADSVTAFGTTCMARCCG
jgi:hypothetical protein